MRQSAMRPFPAQASAPVRHIGVRAADSLEPQFHPIGCLRRRLPLGTRGTCEGKGRRASGKD